MKSASNYPLYWNHSRLYGRVANGEELADEDLPVLAKMRVRLPCLTSDLEDNQKLRDAQLDAENRLTPKQRVKLKKEIEINMYGLTLGGAGKLLESQVKDTKPLTVARDSDVIDPQSGKVLYSNKRPEKPEYKQRSRQAGTKEDFEESQDGGRTWAKVSDGPKFNPKENTEVINEKNRAKFDVTKRLHFAQQGYLPAGNPDWLAELTLLRILDHDDLYKSPR